MKKMKGLLETGRSSFIISVCKDVLSLNQHLGSVHLSAAHQELGVGALQVRRGFIFVFIFHTTMGNIFSITRKHHPSTTKIRIIKKNVYRLNKLYPDKNPG